MTKLVTATLLVLALSACRAAAQDLAEPAAVDAEAVLRLAQGLDAVDFAVREEAMAGLHKLGPAALPVLEPLLEEASPEAAARIRGLASGWGVLLQAERARLPEILKRLRGGDEMPRAEAFDELLCMGPAGREVLEAELGGQGARLDVDLALDRRAVTVGQDVTGKATLRNAGTAPYWRTVGSKNIYFNCSAPKPFGENRPGRRIIRCGGGRGARAWNPDYNPIRRWEAVLPGSEPVELEIRQPLQSLGVYAGELRAYIPSQTIKRQMPRVLLPVEFEMNKVLVAEKAQWLTRPVELFALPDFDAPDAGGEALALRVVPPHAAPACDSVRFEVHLENARSDASVWLEEDLARYAWYAVLDESGVPVHWGSWRSAALGGADEILDARSVAPCAAAEWRLELPAGTLQPGTYRLAIGYEVTPSRVYNTEMEQCLCEVSFGRLSREDGEKVEPFEGGELCARSEPFTIDSE